MTVLVSLVCVHAFAARAFEIDPKHDVHERLTAAALACAAASGDAPPMQCPQSSSGMRPNDFPRITLVIGELTVSAKDLMQAVRWPDDPTSEVALGTIGKFGVKMLQECKPYRKSINQGLLCSSHYGPLQFLHAMASTPNEKTVETRAKILDWSAFLFDVASGELPMNTPYCGYFEGTQRPVQSALFPEEFFGCATKKPWTVQTLFTLRCSKPFSSVTCTELLNPALARTRALGAALHVIQDSFAQGHVLRAACDVKGQNQYACEPVRQFYDYSAQRSELHSLGDQPPVASASCVARATPISDPVLASARAIWFIAHKQREEFNLLLAENVFALAKDALPSAAAGVCFSE